MEKIKMEQRGKLARVNAFCAIAAFGVSVVALVGARAMAADAYQVEQTTPINNTVTVQYDGYNTASATPEGYDPNGYPVVTVVASQPGLYGGHTYTSWAGFVADSTGSVDLFVSATTLAGLTTTPSSETAAPAGTATTTLAAGDGINTVGQWDPFDGIAELAYSTTPSKGNFLAVTSTGNALPATPVVTIPYLTTTTGNGVNLGTNPGNFPGITAQYLQIDNVTITAGNGSTVNPFSTVWPTYAQVTTPLGSSADETYTITDSSNNSIELFDWVTSYSTDGAMAGNPVPTGPVNISGFYDSFNEFVPLSITAVPEPASLGLLAVGGLALLRRRTHSA
jgi:hypothetical protein